MPQVIVRKRSESSCEDCQGKGYVLQPSGGRHYKSHVDLSICHCIETRCLCDKKPPYMYYDEGEFQLKPCACRDVRDTLNRIKSLYSKSNIPPKYRFRRIHEFDTNHPDDDVSRCLAQAHDNSYLFMEELQKFQMGEGEDFVKGWYFFGPPGSGKTLLSCLMLNECILRHQLQVRYVKITRDFFNRIRSSYNLESDLYGKGESLINQLYSINILVLDDFGVQKDSEWEKRMLYDLIDTRYEYVKTTIITSNMPPEELEPLFGGRIFSRLKEMVRIQDLISTDYRDNFMR